MADEKKVCPLLINQPSALCIKEKCAWWLGFANDCAIPTAAGILADSTVCQNTWVRSWEEEAF